MKHSYNKIFIVLFILYIVGINSAFIILPKHVFSEDKNRTLQLMPSFSFERLKEGRFTKEIETYIADQFPKRSTWVGAKAEVESILGKKENNDIYRTEDGYLIQKFKPDTIKEREDKINKINAFLKDNKKINKYFILVPNSLEILRDKLPLYAPFESQKSYINDVKKKLDEDVKFIDVYSELSSKKDEYIYYKTDHHWTTDGAYYAYLSFAKQIGLKTMKKEDFDIKVVTNSFLGTSYSKAGYKDILSDTIKLYESKTQLNCDIEYLDSGSKGKSLYDFDKLKTKDKYAVFLGGNHSLIKIKTNANTNKKILILKDSYANSFIPFLTNNYDEIYVVDLRYYDEELSKIIDYSKVDNILFLYNVNTFAEDNNIKEIH